MTTFSDTGFPNCPSRKRPFVTLIREIYHELSLNLADHKWLIIIPVAYVFVSSDMNPRSSGLTCTQILVNSRAPLYKRVFVTFLFENLECVIRWIFDKMMFYSPKLDTESKKSLSQPPNPMNTSPSPHIPKYSQVLSTHYRWYKALNLFTNTRVYSQSWDPFATLSR